MTKQKQPMGLTARIVIGMFAGIMVGLTLKAIMGDSGDFIVPLGLFELSLKSFFVEGIFEVIGQIFIASLKMLVVPLVFVSLICGTCSLQDTTKLGRIGGKAISLYLVTTAIAISFAMMLAFLFTPGEGVNMTTTSTFEAKEAPTLAQVFIQMFPSNPFAAFASRQHATSNCVCFTYFGIAIALIRRVGQQNRIASLFEDMNVVIMRLVTILMNLGSIRRILFTCKTICH